MNRDKASVGKGDFRSQNSTSKGVNRQSLVFRGGMALLEAQEHFIEWLKAGTKGETWLADDKAETGFIR